MDHSTVYPMPEFHHDILWALVVGIILAFLLGFGMGANDVANAFGASVGSKALTLLQAYILATIFETLGAVLVGYNVIDTMRKSVVDISLYENNPKELLIGQVAILGGCAAWLLIATVLQMPISTTHAIVGATLGFSICCRGMEGIQWGMVREIVASWFISPIFSGIVSACLYLILDHSVLRRDRTIECGLRAMPVFFFFCLTFNAFMVTYQGSKVLHISSLPLWLAIVISFAVGSFTALLVHFIMVPKLRKQASKNDRNTTKLTVVLANKAFVPDQSLLDKTSNPHSLDVTRSRTLSGTESCFSRSTQRSAGLKRFVNWLLPDKSRVDDEETLNLFITIQKFTACFAGFAHGANDVSNAIAPLAALIAIYKDQDVHQHGHTPIYVLAYGVFGICVGLWMLGHRVIRTVGTKMSEINPASGFTIDIGAALTALVSSKIGLPISTTHCLVGSVIAVGSIRSGKGIDWKIFRDIAISWMVTLPVAGLISATIMFGLKRTI